MNYCWGILIKSYPKKETYFATNAGIHIRMIETKEINGIIGIGTMYLDESSVPNIYVEHAKWQLNSNSQTRQ